MPNPNARPPPNEQKRSPVDTPAPGCQIPPASRLKPGEVTEWSKVLDWKSSVRVTVPRVRIPPSPQQNSTRISALKPRRTARRDSNLRDQEGQGETQRAAATEGSHLNKSPAWSRLGQRCRLTGTYRCPRSGAAEGREHRKVIPPSPLIFLNRCRYFKPQHSRHCPSAAQS